MPEDVTPTELDPDKFYGLGADEQFMRELDSNPDLLHIVIWMGRVGASLFARTLELKHYTPGTRRNDDYHVLLMKDFGGIGPFLVVSVPIKERDIVERVLAETDMALEHGVPHVLGGGVKPEEFPLRSDNVWSLRNANGSIAYTQQGAKLEEENLKKIYEMEEEHNRWMDGMQEFWYEGRLWWRSEGRHDPVLQKACQICAVPDSTGKEVIWWTDLPPVRPPGLREVGSVF
jgi:hypothetical protein